MSAAVLKRLREAGLLREVDHALGELLLRRHADAPVEVREAVALAAALASRLVVGGHSGLRLDAADAVIEAMPAAGSDAALDAKPLTAASLRELLPEPAHWYALLRQSAWVGDDPTANGVLCLLDDVSAQVRPGRALLQLRRYARHEQRVAAQLRLRRTATALDEGALASALAARFDADDPLDGGPLAAARVALSSRLLVLCGGPGTGKTHTVLRLLDALVAGDPALRRIHLAAPTGKAASRLDDSLRQRLPGMDRDGRINAALAGGTQTLHRLLGLRADGGRPRHHPGRPLATDLLVVDEASMVDLPLMARLLDALPPSARLILVGDRDQLASVETGDVLTALDAAAGEGGPLAGHRVTLQHNHRFGAGSAIGRLADAVREGDISIARELLASGGSLQLEAGAVDVTLSRLLERAQALHARLCAASDPEAALACMDDYRILCALRRGPLGADAVNRRVDARLVAGQARLGSTNYPGQLLLVRENQPRLGLANGDTGIVLASASGRLEAWFRDAQGQPRALPLALLPAHQSAWALSVHQSQGSEYAHVDIVLGERDNRVLGRQLLYTAVTRARQSLAVFAGAEALDMSVRRRLTRESGLLSRLRQGA